MGVKQYVETRIIRRRYVVTFCVHNSARAIAADIQMIPQDAVLIECEEDADGGWLLSFEQEREEEN